jgi:hypothetical protein
MKRKPETNALDAQLGRAMRKMLEQMEKSEDRDAEDYQRGGPVRGPGTATSDSILARVSNGEYILPKPAVDMVGVKNLETIRQAALQLGAPGYALGGMVDNYGNDLSLANRMNAGAESMRTMREGPAAQPTAQPAPDLSGLSSLFGPSPLQQQQQAYKAARGGADPLDVASGRFDREYQPGVAMGGQVRMDKGQWNQLPRFKDGGGFDWNRGLIPQAWEAVPEESKQRVRDAFSGRGAFAKEQAMTTTPPATPAAPAQGLPDYSAIARANQQPRLPQTGDVLSYLRNPSQPAGPEQLSPYVGGAPAPANLAVLPKGMEGAANLPGTDIYRSTTSAPGFGQDNPNRIPAPGQIAGTTNYAVLGVSAMGGGSPGQAVFQGQRVGGGTMSVLDQGNGGTIEGNVAALNRQYEALKSRNQAYGWGGGGGMPAGPDAQTLANLANPFYQPGQGYGDEIMARDRFMRQMNRKGGEGRRSFAQRQQGALAQLQGLQEQGQQRAQGALGLANLGQKQQQMGYEAQLAQQKALQDAQQFAATYGMERRKVGLSEANAAAEAQRNAINDKLNAAKIVADIQRGNRPTADAALGQARANYMQAMVAGDRAGAQLWKGILDQIGQPTPYYAQ